MTPRALLLLQQDSHRSATACQRPNLQPTPFYRHRLGDNKQWHHARHSVTRRSISPTKNTLINPKRRHRSQQQSPGYIRSSIPLFLLACWHSPYIQSSGGKKNRMIKNKHNLIFFFFVSQLGPNYSVDWYKHWLTWANDYSVYGTHMQALVSLINPIRSFGEKRQLIHMLLTATHTHTTVLQDGSVFSCGNVRQEMEVV